MIASRSIHPNHKEHARLRERQTRRLHRPNPGTPGLGPRGEGQSEVALGSGRSCANTAAVPDVEMIETTLAGGTVAREMICAGLSEHRTPVVYSAAEFTKGCVWGAAGSENLPAESQGWHSGRKERLRTNPQTMDRDPDRSCRLHRHKRHRKHLPTNPPHWPGLVGSAPQAPRDLSHRANPGETATETGRLPHVDGGAPSPVLAPGAALGSRLRVALSSGQVIDHRICDSIAEPLMVRAASPTGGSR